MMPLLQKFGDDSGYDVSLFRNCLSDGWQALSKGMGRRDWSNLAQECAKGAPDTEEFDHPLVSAALNAALSIAALMTFLSDKDVNHVAEASELAEDTVALYAQAVENDPPHSLNLQEVLSHTLVQRELGQQLEDLAFLESLPKNLNAVAIKRINERAERNPMIIPFERP
jgi:uncharacterized protein YjaG (DUF416 family)